MNPEKGEYKLSAKEKVYQRAYQYRYYHEKVKMKVACELCGSMSTIKSLVSHKRTAKCKNLSRAYALQNDRVEKLEFLIAKLSLEKAANLDNLLCASDVSTAAE